MRGKKSKNSIDIQKINSASDTTISQGSNTQKGKLQNKLNNYMNTRNTGKNIIIQN